MDYGFAKTQPEIRSSFDLFDNFARGPASIVDAFNLVPDLQRTGAPGFVILVANSADSVNNAVASAATLKNLGFQIVTIAFKSTGFFDNLASQASYNFKIQEDADRKTVASQIGNIIDDRSCLSSSTTTPQPTSSGCTGRWVYNGDLSIAFEFIEGSNGSQKVVDFVANTLLKNANSYGLTNDVNGNQPSKLELLPYPQTDQYPIFGYGSIKSSEDIANFISAYQGIQFQDTDPSIADAFDYLSEHPGRSKVQVVLLVASDGSDVQNTVATANNLKNSGYLVITVAQTSPANDFTPLASGDKYSLQIGNGNDDDVAAQIASLLLDWSFVCFDDGSSTAAPATTNLSTSPFPSTTPIPPCDSPYSGKIATVFELNTEQPEIQSVVNFVRDNLYNSNNYNFGTITNAINVPYANTDNYADNILAYGDAKSLADLQTNIDNLNTNAVVTVNPTISDGLQWLYANRSPGTTKAVIVIVGNHQDDDTGSTTNWLRSLKQQGYQVISVGVGSAHADFSSLADKPEWYFQVGDTNGQYVADQISSILCHL